MVIKFSLEMLETGHIELVKLLKATGVCPSGGMAKIAIREGKVRVDGLVELRKGRKISQATVAEALGIGQMQISRLEKRKDPRLSTMQRTVAAMGGHLTMIVTFPDQEPVVLVPAQSKERASRRKSA